MLYSDLIGKFARKPKLALFAIVVFGIFLRLVFFSGMDASDSLRYSKTANDINIGKGIDLNGALTLSTRLGLIYPTAFSYKLFGINDISSVLFVLLTSIAMIVLVFYFGRLLFSDRVGLMAAFLLSFFPLEVAYSTKLFSDLPSAFFMALGVYLFLLSEIKKHGNSSFYFFSGISIGIGYMIRESALLIALFFLCYMLYKKRVKKEYFLVPFGVLIVFAFESLLFLGIANDPLFRFHASQQHLEEASAAHDYFGRLDFPAGLFHYPYIILTSSLIAFFYIFIFIAIICLMKTREKNYYLLLLWFIPLLLYLSFGSSSLSAYIPFRAVDRYLEVITVPGMLILAVFLLEKKKIIERMLAPLVIAILFSASVFSIYHDDRTDLDNLKNAYSLIRGFDKTAYADSRTIKALGYISGYSGDIDIKDYPSSLGAVEDAYIIVNKPFIKGLKDADKNKKFPAEIDSPLSSWVVIKEIGKAGYEIVVYYSA